MEHREYYAIRKGHVPKDDVLTFENFKKAFRLIYEEMEYVGYFQKYLGMFCVDAGDINGLLGSDNATAIYLKTGCKDIYPFNEKIEWYDEITLYTAIEFLHDISSKPLTADFHSFGDCGWHVKTSIDEAGKEDFRNKVNPLLKRYKNAQLSENGEILLLADSGLETLIKAPMPSDDNENINSRIESAIIKFRRASATTDDRRDALKNLADVLEFVKKDAMKLNMNKDVHELFDIANNFGIRHHNPKQKTEYDKATWHAWMFYCYLSTIHLCIRLIKENKTA